MHNKPRQMLVPLDKHEPPYSCVLARRPTVVQALERSSKGASAFWASVFRSGCGGIGRRRQPVITAARQAAKRRQLACRLISYRPDLKTLSDRQCAIANRPMSGPYTRNRWRLVTPGAVAFRSDHQNRQSKPTSRLAHARVPDS